MDELSSEDGEIIAVSAATGEGIDELKEQIAAAADTGGAGALYCARPPEAFGHGSAGRTH